jgi:hypothetical protein
VLLTKEFSLVPRFQDYRFKGPIFVEKSQTQTPLPLLFDQGYTYKASSGVIKDSGGIALTEPYPTELFVYKYEGECDDLKTVFKFDVQEVTLQN